MIQFVINQAKKIIAANEYEKKIFSELTDENKIIQQNDFNNEQILKISFGKKKHYLIKII